MTSGILAHSAVRALALVWYQCRVAIFERLGNRTGLPRMYNNIAEVHRVRGEYEVALGWYQRHVVLFEELGDRASLAVLYTNLGFIAAVQGALSQALELFTRSRDLYTAIGLSEKVAEEEELIAQILAALAVQRV